MSTLNPFYFTVWRISLLVAMVSLFVRLRSTTNSLYSRPRDNAGVDTRNRDR